MIRILLIIFFASWGWSSPLVRNATADFLRLSADFVEPGKNNKKIPKSFQVPNPFYEKSLED